MLITYSYFLGLKTLTVIKNAAEMAGARMDGLAYDNPDIYAYISTGKTDGVFQLESGGMQAFMKELRPECFEDLIAGISLYRPGPMDFIPQYIKGKKDREGIRYACPQLKPILEATYGCIVYQEQVMQIVRDLGGYTMGRSDLVRRAMSKKKQKVMEEERRNFIYGNKEEGVPGCAANGIPEEVASGIYDTMMDFAKYAFNKSHAACYAAISYQTAWLKYYYPKEFMAALISSVMDKPAKVAGYVAACREMGIQVLPPDINKSGAGFTVSGDGIRFGLSAVKGAGSGVVADILKERGKGGEFTCLDNFAERTVAASRDINRTAVENFIKAGAFDCFGKTRMQMAGAYSSAMADAQRTKKNSFAGQLSIFDLEEGCGMPKYARAYPDCGEYPQEERLMLEKEVLGAYVSGHPLDGYRRSIMESATFAAQDFIRDDETGECRVRDGKAGSYGGMVTVKRTIFTKKNQQMAFITVEGLAGAVEAVVFPSVYEKYGSLLKEDAKVLIKGKASHEAEKDAKLICEEVLPLPKDCEKESARPKKAYVRIATEAGFRDQAQYILSLSRRMPGDGVLKVYVEETKRLAAVPAKITRQLYEELVGHFGSENVRLV